MRPLPCRQELGDSGRHPEQEVEAEVEEALRQEEELEGRREEVVKRSKEDQIRPVADISPHAKYRIKVKVERMGEVRTVQKKKLSGEVLECTVADSSGQVKVSAFNQDGGNFVQQMSEKLKEGSVYYLSGAALKPVIDIRFNKTGHNYEMFWGKFTEVEGPLEEEDIQSLNKVEAAEVGCLLDVIGVPDTASKSITLCIQRSGLLR